MEEPRELAELLALDFECCNEEQGAGAEIRLLNATCEELYAVAVRRFDAIAA